MSGARFSGTTSTFWIYPQVLRARLRAAELRRGRQGHSSTAVWSNQARSDIFGYAHRHVPPHRLSGAVPGDFGFSSESGAGGASAYWDVGRGPGPPPPT